MQINDDKTWVPWKYTIDDDEKNFDDSLPVYP